MDAKRLVARVLVVAQLGSLLALLPAAPAAAGAKPPSEWVIGPHRRVVLLTLDGVTSERKLIDILSVLAEREVKASFFMPGAWISEHRRAARLITAAGHALGNRGYGKKRFTELGDRALRSSINRAARVLRRVGSYPKPFLRPPKGARDLRILRIAGSMNYRSGRWTHHPGAGLPKKIVRRVVRQAQRGSIISLDLWRKSNRMALGNIIDRLRAKGFRFKTIESLVNAHAVRWDVTLRSGSSGPEVAYLQKRLRRTSYPAGRVDGHFGYSTLQGVYAFEKVKRLARDGVVTPADMTNIAASRRPKAPKRKPKDFVDIDISRQVLFVVRNRRVRHTLPISSGNEEYYTYDGNTYKAHTPRGNFVIERKIAGRRVSHLGTLWWPNYFVGGYAIHGSDSVPTYPASHGCVRIPRYVEQKFFHRNPIGMPVFVHD
ncbi:MAG: polysaccharide deacetylase family protein [Actinomycetota bacterium]